MNLNAVAGGTQTEPEAAVLPILSHYINGAMVEVLPDKTGPVYNPATGQVIARVPRGGQTEVDAAVVAAKAAFPAWRDMPLIARSNIFFAFRGLMYEHREELARLITRDHGKTFPDALAEVLRGIETIDFACGLPVHLSGMNTPNVSTKVDTYTMRAPLGVVAAITPFNFPVMVP
ncbi:MAG: aldehyde dehydrogenase family protein, partial [Candidatus Limnocylindrales bacterium]